MATEGLLIGHKAVIAHVIITGGGFTEGGCVCGFIFWLSRRGDPGTR